MKLKHRVKDIILLILLLLCVAIFVVLYVDNGLRNKVIIKLYPLRATIALTHKSCSDDAPGWMKKALSELVYNQNAPTSQLVYISPQGDLSHCESGYQGTALLSPVNDEQARFRYASVTKLFTAEAILSQVRNGTLSLDDKVWPLLNIHSSPEDPRMAEIEISDLLAHYGGFDRYKLNGFNMFYDKDPICPEHLDKLAHQPLSFTPKEKFSYSNLGYCLLGEVLAIQKNTPYSELMDQEFDLKKHNMVFLDNNKRSDEVEANHIETGLMGIGNIYDTYNYDALQSSAGLSGNAIELAKAVYEMAHQPTPNILSHYADEECYVSQPNGCPSLAMYHYQPQGSENVFYWRSGALPGFSSLVVVDESGAVVVWLGNGLASNIGHNIVDGLDIVIQNWPR